MGGVQIELKSIGISESRVVWIFLLERSSIKNGVSSENTGEKKIEEILTMHPLVSHCPFSHGRLSCSEESQQQLEVSSVFAQQDISIVTVFNESKYCIPLLPKTRSGNVRINMSNRIFTIKIQLLNNKDNYFQSISPIKSIANKQKQNRL